MLLQILLTTLCLSAALAEIDLLERLKLSDLTVTQSSTGWGGNPQRAVDKNTGQGDYGYDTCSHTGSNSGKQWWKVVLPKKEDITKVRIYNRLDCCQDRIDGAEVWIDDRVKCGGALKYSEDAAYYDMTCPEETAGRAVEVRLNGNYLHMCEVQVFGPGGESNILDGSYNLVVKQNSIYGSGIAKNAVDGNENGDYNGGKSCTHTNGKENNYWSVELPGGRNKVSKVVLFNRLDCCSDRIDGAEVYLDSKKCGSVSYREGQPSYKVFCDGEGSKVTVKQNNNYLTLCEVEVYGKEECSCKGIDGDNFDPEEMWFNIDAGLTTPLDPYAVAQKVIDNRKGKSDVSITFTSSETYQEERFFEDTFGGSVTIGTSFNVGVPLIHSATISASLTASMSFTTGGTTTESRTLESSFECVGPPGYVTNCNVLIYKYKAAIPYEQTWQHKRMKDCTCVISGTYTDIAASRLSLSVEAKDKKEDEEDE